MVLRCDAVRPLVVVALLVVASTWQWLRGKSWRDVAHGPPLAAVLGAVAGVVALALAVAATPLVERITDAAVQWSTYPVVRGSVASFSAVAAVVVAIAVASELVMRGWIVETVLEFGGHRVLAIAAGALVEALLADGGRPGAAVFGVALGMMYLGAGRSVVAPICARVAFSLGALVLEALRVVG